MAWVTDGMSHSNSIRLCSIVFFKKVTLTQPECDVIYTFTKRHIHINIGINKKAISSSLHWYETWLEKSYTRSGSGNQRQGRVKFAASLCRLRSIAAHRDHFVRRPSVCPSVCLSVCPSICHTFHSYVLQATHAFLGMLPLFFRDHFVRRLSVCPSVCLSVRPSVTIP